MFDVPGFNRFIQNKEEEMKRIVEKQERRRKYGGKIKQKPTFHERSMGSVSYRSRAGSTSAYGHSMNKSESIAPAIPTPIKLRTGILI